MFGIVGPAEERSSHGTMGNPASRGLSVDVCGCVCVRAHGKCFSGLLT